MGTQRNFDWMTIREEYITQKISLKKLTEKYGVPMSTLQRKSKSEGWLNLRKKYECKVNTEIVERTARKVGRTEANKLAKVIRTANRLASHFDAVTKDKEQFRRFLVQNPETGELSEQVLERYDVKRMKEFTAALKELTEVIRNVNDLPFEKDKGEGGQNNELKVIIQSPHEDYGN